VVRITCSSKLHTAPSEGGVLEGEAAPGPTVRLGDWAATPAGRDLLVAIEAKTCLTLVTRIHPVAGLRDRLVAALRHSLVNGRVSPEVIEAECRGLRQALFVRGRNPALAEALGFAKIEGQAHVEGGQDEASVQDTLNEYPYGECPASCPTEAVARLFHPRCVLHDTASRIGAASSRPTRRPTMK
jgi:hypothetical protein